MNKPHLPSNADGFLRSGSDSSDADVKLLGAIKDDTAKLREVAERQLAENRRALDGRGAPGSRGGLSAHRPPTVSPVGRTARTQLDRDPATGRLVPRAASQPAAAVAQRQARDFSNVAKAANDVARTAEASRREAKADRASQSRGSDGRFGAGDSGARRGDSRLGGAAGALASSSGAMIEGADQVDPLLGAASELKGLGNGIRGVVEPLGRMGSGLFGNRESESEGWLRKIWREFRLGRKESAKASRDTLRGLKGVRGGGGEGGGFFSSLMGMLPMMAVGKGLLIAGAGTLVAGIASWMSSAISGTITKAIEQGWELLKRTPIIGSIAHGAERFARWMTGSDTGPLKSDRPGMEGALINAANAAGADSNLVLAIAKKESGLDPTARPRRKDGTLMSSAHGLGQFTDDTWLDVIRRFGQKAGVGRGAATTAAEAAALRDDPQLQARMLAEWTAKNAAQARRAYEENDPAAVYAMHVLGEGDGPKFLRALRANPNALLSSVLSDEVIANNPSLFSGKTLGDAKSALSGAVSGASRDIGAPRLPSTALARLPTAANVPTTPSGPRVRPPAPVQEPRPVPAMESASAARVSSPAPAPAARVVVQTPIGQDVRDRGIAHVLSGGIGGRHFRA
jgi:hypothetical protein